MSLSYALVAAPGRTPERYMVFLHGILGRGGNWRGIARRFVAERPAWGAALVDLRLHGGSQEGFAPPHTIDAAAADLDGLALPAPIAGVLGHSFGGKVALAYAARRGDLEVAWVIDALPGARAAAPGDSTQAVMELLARLPQRHRSREAFMAAVETAGQPRGIAEWLAMNLVRDVDAYRLALDLPALRELLADYFARDLWPVVESPPGATRLHLVIATGATTFSAADRDRALRLLQAPERRLSVHLLPTGHWVHSEAPGDLLRLLVA